MKLSASGSLSGHEAVNRCERGEVMKLATGGILLRHDAGRSLDLGEA